MSAILSADDLNDFISPGVACIKPVETLPKKTPQDIANEYEVTTEDKVAAANAPPASISLTDCLACSGCVTSAEAVLVSLQSHAEVLNTLDAWPELSLANPSQVAEQDGKIFVATVSPQTRASIAATYGVSEREAGSMISQLLSGPLGLRSTGAHGSGFTWVLDTNPFREIALVAAAEEVALSLSPSPTQSSSGGTAREDQPKKPVLASACPGWICYAEKTHPHVLPHISRLKSPQALAGTMIKSVLSKHYNIPSSKIWHLAIMPCFDKKLEASREELTDTQWSSSSLSSDPPSQTPIRDVDCVITAREVLMLATSRSLSFPLLPRSPITAPPFPDPQLASFLFPRLPSPNPSDPAAGTSGGYLWHILHSTLHTYTSTTHPDARILINRGRNLDVVDYEIVAGDEVLWRAARYYGFRNIQNLVRRLRPAKVSRLPGAARRPVPASRGGKSGGVSAVGGGAAAMTEYAFVEVMACPGGCTNGGGQIKVEDVGALRAESGTTSDVDGVAVAPQKEWLGLVDEAYYSAEEEDNSHTNSQVEEADINEVVIDGVSHTRVKKILTHWATFTGVEVERLILTSYRRVESEVGNKGVSDVERVAGLASSIGGGW